MGQCIGNNTSSKKYKFNKTDPLPNDIDSYANIPLPMLQFELRISNLKLKNIDYRNVSSLLIIQDILDLKLENKDIENAIVKVILKVKQWNIDHRIFFKLNDYQLRQKFLVIKILNQNCVELGELSLNLFLIATGPYHHDFPIKYTNKKLGRVCLDIRIIQKIELTLETKSVTVNLIKQRPQEIFNYSIKLITNSSTQTKQTDLSYNKQVTVQKRKLLQQQRRSSSIRKQSKISDQVHNITWTKEEAEALKGHLPFIQTQIMVSDINSGSFQFLLWAQKQQNEVAQCYVAFNKIFQNEFKVTNTGFQNRDIVIKQKIWNHGKLIGEMIMKLNIVVSKYFKQMVVFVRTQQGIQKTSPIFTINQDRKNQCQQIVQLYKIKQALDTDSLKLTNYIQNNMKQNEIKFLKNIIKKNLEKLQPLFVFTVKESSIIFNYANEEELSKGHIIILELGFKILEYLQQDQTMYHQICWKLMIAIMKRGQMSLRYIGFKKQDYQNIKKIQFSIKYQTFLYRILKMALGCLNKKALQQSQRKFVELFCAYAYFRIPKFRDCILQSLIRQNDPQIEQWRGTSFSLSNPQINKFVGKVDQTGILFDWQTNFYNYIEKDERCKQNYIYLNQILAVQDWKERMRKRGVAFFYFLIYWIEYVQQVAIRSQNVQWHYLPGYMQLLRALLQEMKIRSILHYPDSLIDATIKFLSNQMLLNIFITILFKKTLLFESNSVIKTMEIINSYLRSLSISKKHIPTTFNYNYFLLGIKEILQNDHSFAISRCLLMIYNSYNMFSLEFRRDICMFLLGKVFFKLFLNWSNNVRSIFQHLLIFRIHLQSNIIQKTNQDDGIMIRFQYEMNQQIRKRYLNLKNILQNVKIVKQNKELQNLTYNFQKEYFKKMKKKLYDKRRGNKQKLLLQKTQSQLTYATKKSHKGEQFLIKQLIKKAPQRYLSQATNLKISYPKVPNNNKEKENQLVAYKQIEPKRKVSQEIEIMGLNKNRRKMSNASSTDHQIQQINLQLLQYLNDSLTQFYKYENIFEKNYSNATQKDQVPYVQIHVPLDQGEIRPENIDEW